MINKSFFVILILNLFCVFLLKSQYYYPSEFECNIYKKVYNQIVADTAFSGKSINVSRKIIGTDYQMFFFQPIKVINEETTSSLKKLIELDKKNISNDTMYYCFDNSIFYRSKPGVFYRLNPKVKFDINKVIVSFSKIIKSEIMTDYLDLFVYVTIGDFGDLWFGEFVFYYFNIDYEGNIINVETKRGQGL